MTARSCRWIVVPDLLNLRKVSLQNRRGSDVKRIDMSCGHNQIPGAFGENSSLKRVINIHRDKALVSRRKRSNTTGS